MGEKSGVTALIPGRAVIDEWIEVMEEVTESICPEAGPITIQYRMEDW